MKKYFIIYLLILVSIPIYGQNEWKKTNGPFSGDIYRYITDSAGKIIFSTIDNTTFIMDEFGKNLSKISFDTSVSLYNGIKEPFLNIKNSNILLTDGFTVFLLNDIDLKWEILGLNLDSAEKASYKQFFQIGDTVFLSILSKGLYKLSEDFKSWKRVYSYLPNIPVDFYKIVCSKNNVYFAVNEKGVFKSKELSNNWDTIMHNTIYYKSQWLYITPSGTIYVRDYFNCYKYDESQDSLIFDFSIPNSSDMNNCELLFFDKNDIFTSNGFKLLQSYDYGKTYFEIFTDSLCNYRIGDIQRSSNKLYFLDNFRLFSSNDNAKSWQSIDPESNKSPIINILPISKDSVVVINQRALFTTFDRGMNYKLAFPQCTTSYSKLIQRKNLVFGTMENYFFYSDISDLKWTIKKMFTYDFDVDSNSDIYYSRQELFKSIDFLANSIVINGNLPVYGGTKKPYVTSICTIGNKEIIAGVAYGNNQIKAIYKSYDDGLTWAMKINNLRETTGFLRDNNLIIGIPKYYFDDTSKKVLYISKDFGETWTIMETPFAQGDYKYFLSPNRTLFASEVSYKQLGVFSSNDLGKSFIPFPTELDSKAITEIAFGTDSTIWFGTDSGSVYYSEKPEFSSVRESQIETGICISPNPTTDFIEISVGSRHALTNSDIRIFNVFGEMVSTSVCSADTSASGGHKIDVSSLPSGVYFVRVGDKVGKFVKI